MLDYSFSLSLWISRRVNRKFIKSIDVLPCNKLQKTPPVSILRGLDAASEAFQNTWETIDLQVMCAIGRTWHTKWRPVRWQNVWRSWTRYYHTIVTNEEGKKKLDTHACRTKEVKHAKEVRRRYMTQAATDMQMYFTIPTYSLRQRTRRL